MGKSILVTGLIRSGTTWVGRVLSTSVNTVYIHEPFNPDSLWNACFPTPCHMLYLTDENGGVHVERWRRLLQLKPIFKGPWLEPIEKDLEAHIGGLLSQVADRDSVIPIVKDPIALFSVEWLVENFQMTPVFTIRHPVGVVKSILRLGWMDTGHMAFVEQQPLLMRRFFPGGLEEVRELIRSNPDPIDRVCCWVRLLYSVVATYKKAHPEWIYVPYEDLTLNPEARFLHLMEALELRPSQHTLDEIGQGNEGQYDPNLADQGTLKPIPSKLDEVFSPTEKVKDWHNKFERFFADLAEDFAGIWPEPVCQSANSQFGPLPPLSEYSLSENDRLVFLQLPKTGGMTLSTILGQHFAHQEISPCIRPAFELPSIFQDTLNQYRYLHGHFPYELVRKLLRRQSTFFVTMLRDPVERFISHFFYWQTIYTSIRAPAHVIEEFHHMSLAEFAHAPDFPLNLTIRNLQTRLIASTYEEETPEGWFDRYQKGEAHLPDIELGKERLNEFAFVGLTERFQDALFLLAYTFGWPPAIDCLRLNVTAGRPRQEQISPETLGRIAELNAADLTLYRHAQQLFEARFTRMTHELLERYGERRHASMKLPLPTEEMVELLERHYARRYAERHRTAISSLDFAFDQALSGVGWYAAEGPPGHTYRWTGPGTRSTLDLPLAPDAGDLQIKLFVNRAIMPDVLASLTLSVNEQRVPLRKVLRLVGPAIFIGYIPQGALAAGRSFTRLTFEVERTVAPCTLNPASADDRPLGVALGRLEIQPVGEEERHGPADTAAGGGAEFTGERFVPTLNWPELSYEHWHRYLFASQLVVDKSVLDVGCGEGYGTHLLAGQANYVVGVDVDPQVVQTASGKYFRPNLEFRPGLAQKLPVEDEHVFDVVVCFEILEHLTETEQLALLAEIKRVLKPGGLLLISTPNKYLYSEKPGYHNDFHRAELYVGEFEKLLNRFFPQVHMLGQRVYPTSYIWPLSDAARKTVTEYQLEYVNGYFRPCDPDQKEALFCLAVCSDEVHTVPDASILVDVYRQAIDQKAGQIVSLNQQIAAQEHDLQQQASQITALESGLQARAEEYTQLQSAYLEAQERIKLLEAALEEQPGAAVPAGATAPQAERPAIEVEQGVEAGIRAELERAVGRYRELAGREPAILDWNTGLQLQQKLPAHNIFSPSVPNTRAVLPYLDDSIDVVIYPADDPAFMAEAIRVARVAAIGSDMEVKWNTSSGELAAAPGASVSVVIPVYNHVEQTTNCLAQLRRTLPADFGGEVIVVDDGSTDETPARLQEWAAQERYARVIRNPENAGFIASCNAGVRTASGEIVVFLNNDTLPQSGWLEALLRTFRDYPDAGAVGGKLIYPDGKLQEAGGIVFSDGSSANFGKGCDSDDSLYNYVREVDYCSGALLATRRSLFLESGEFDNEYRPAYYEDTDYCFRVRERGYRVYYQPESRVIHVEGATCGTNLSAGTKQFQVANRAVFVKKWGRVLDQQPPRPGRFDLAAWHALAVRGAGKSVEEQ